MADDPRAQVIADFLNDWRFCPVANSEQKSQPTLLDSARQLVAAIDGAVPPTEQRHELSTPVRVYPQTAREALFEIRRRAAEVHVDLDVSLLAEEIDKVALEGLVRTEPINFQLSDELADRLAEAHSLLRRLRGSAALGGDIAEALSLPPDLETMVERRRR